MRLAPLLIGVAFLDELGSGIPFVAAPEIKTGFGVSYAQAAGWLLFAITALGVLLEPPLFLLADRLPRRWFVCGGLAALGSVCIAAGLAPSYPLLVLALLLYGPLSGCGVALAQATLADARPDDLERALVRWTFSGSVGDLATPIVVALAAGFSVGWRGAFVGVGAALIAYAALLWRQDFPAVVRVASEAEAEPRLSAALRTALRNPRLLRWAIAATLCALMDEILIAFGSLYLADVLDMGLGARTAVLTSCELGVIAGLAASDILIARMSLRALLLASAGGCAIAWLGFLLSGTTQSAALGLFATGFFAATQYPLVKAQAYRALPGSSGAVNAVLTLFGVAQLGIPLALGFTADHFGLTLTLSLLALQPLGVAALVAFARAGEFVDPRDPAS